MPWAAPVTRATPFAAIVILLGRGENELETDAEGFGSGKLALASVRTFMYHWRGDLWDLGSYCDGPMGIPGQGRLVPGLKARPGLDGNQIEKRIQRQGTGKHSESVSSGVHRVHNKESYLV